MGHRQVESLCRVAYVQILPAQVAKLEIVVVLGFQEIPEQLIRGFVIRQPNGGHPKPYRLDAVAALVRPGDPLVEKLAEPVDVVGHVEVLLIDREVLGGPALLPKDKRRGADAARVSKALDPRAALAAASTAHCMP